MQIRIASKIDQSDYGIPRDVCKGNFDPLICIRGVYKLRHKRQTARFMQHRSLSNTTTMEAYTLTKHSVKYMGRWWAATVPLRTEKAKQYVTENAG